MSAKQQGIVWELDLSHAEAWVLMALADHADHDGENVYPGVELLAWKTGYSTKQVSRILARLEEIEVIKPISGGRGRGNVQQYTLTLDKAPRKTPLEKRTKRPVIRAKKSGQNVHVLESTKADKMSGLASAKSGHSEPQKGTFETGKGDISESTPIRNAHGEPSGNQHEPSSVCVAHAQGITEQDVLDWCKAKRKDLVKPEIYANKAWRGQWANVMAEVSAWKAAQSAEQRSAQPDAPADGQVAVQASALVTALFAAKGWVLDRATPTQWDEARTVEAQLAVYEESSTPALVEFVTRAGEFYANAGKTRWLLGFLPNDWPQIYRWCNRADAKGNAYVGAHHEKPLVESPTENHGELIELEQAEELASLWLNNLPDIERERLFTERRNQIFKKSPGARQWDADVLEQTIRSGLIREFIEQQQEVPHAA